MQPHDLPVTAQGAWAHEAQADDNPAHAAAPRILIVDDDPGTVQALDRMPDGVGELHFACSGAEPLRQARAQRPDLVLLDADMPVMNGFEVCHALKADPARPLGRPLVELRACRSWPGAAAERRGGHAMSRARWAMRQALGVLLALWLGALPAGVTAAPLTLAIGELPHYATLLLAERLSYFAEAGLEVKVIPCVNGKRCLQHLLDGEAQVAGVADVPIVMAAHTGRGFDIVATLATSTQESRFIARRDRGIRGPADLTGRRIGFVRGTTAHFYADAFLRFHGIDPASVTLVALDPARAPAQLASGEVDAAALYQPHAAQAQLALGERALLLPAPRLLYTAAVSLISQSAAQGVDDERLRRLLQALQRAGQFMQAEPARARALLASRLKLDATLVAAIVDSFDYRLQLSQTLIGTLEAESRWAVREGLVTDRTVPDFLDHVRPGPLSSLDRRAVSIIR
jgi:ABC-type nitrate/sulfonate/bicarbonate transport system substrate-binding protein